MTGGAAQPVQWPSVEFNTTLWFEINWMHPFLPGLFRIPTTLALVTGGAQKWLFYHQHRFFSDSAMNLVATLTDDSFWPQHSASIDQTLR
jgi:hypothetical protein